MSRNRIENTETIQSYIRLVNDMILDRTYDKYSDFLKSVRDYAEKNGTLTVKQMDAIFKIYNGGAK